MADAMGEKEDGTLQKLSQAQIDLCNSLEVTGPDTSAITKHARLIQNAYDRGATYFAVWKNEIELEKLKKLETALSEAVKLYHDLHPYVRSILEDEVQALPIVRRDEDKVVIEMGARSQRTSYITPALNHTAERRHQSLGSTLQFLSLFVARSDDPKLSTVITRTADGLAPLKDLDRLSIDRLERQKKNAVVDSCRTVFSNLTGRNAPKGVNETGEFFEFLTNVFQGLNINADPRRAVENWKSDIDNNWNRTQVAPEKS